MSEDFSILMGVLAPMFKAHVQGNLGKLILIPSRGIEPLVHLGRYLSLKTVQFKEGLKFGHYMQTIEMLFT